MRIMALDVGDRRIGVAISDPTKTLAKPLTVIERGSQKEDLARIAQLVQEHEVEEVIVGYPRSLNGKSYGQAKRIEDFALPLSRKLDVQVAFWDERFSTVSAEELMRKMGLSKEERREKVDAIAAAVILQDFLDARPNLKEEPS